MQIYKYSPNGTNNEHFIIYDNAKFEDNFDGLKVYMNQLSLTNKERTSNGKTWVPSELHL